MLLEEFELGRFFGFWFFEFYGFFVFCQRETFLPVRGAGFEASGETVVEVIEVGEYGLRRVFVAGVVTAGSGRVVPTIGELVVFES